MSGAPAVRSDTRSPRSRKRAVRFVMRFVMPLVMLGFGTYTVVNGGLQGLVVLLPILAAHLVGFMVIYPVWVLYRRRRRARTGA